MSVVEPTAAAAERPSGRVSLTVCCMTAGPGAQVAALLERFRPVAAEILVAADERAGEDTVAELATVADRLILYPYAEPVDRPLPWLFEISRGEWFLTVDDDEIPSPRLIELLPEIVADEQLTHCWIARRWVYPTSGTFLDEAPWRPDYQLRLVRRDARLVRFSDEFHRPIVADGPGRYVDTPLWHVDPLQRSREQRLEKARRYERMRPGMRIAGRALNFAFYVPELRPEPRLGTIPDGDRDVIEQVLAATAPSGAPRAAEARAERAEIDAAWPGADAEQLDGRIELLERPAAMTAGEQRTIDVRAHNLGAAAWDWGHDGAPPLRLASRWLTPAGAPVSAEQLRTAFPRPVPPAASDLVPVHVRAPDRPGHYRLVIDFVHEHVRWLGRAVELELDVLPHRRVAVAAGEAGRRLAPRLVEVDQRLEPVLVAGGPGAIAEPYGYPLAPGARSYLLEDAPPEGAGLALVGTWRALVLVRAARRRQRGRPAARLPRGGSEFLEALAGSETLLVALPPPPALRDGLELLATLLAARALGVRTAVSAESLGHGAGLGSRLLREAAARAADGIAPAADELIRLAAGPA